MDTPGIDLSALQQLQSLMQPTEEEQKQARSRALILAGAGLLGVPKGQTMRGIGRAIGGGLLSYQNDLHDISATKAQNLHAADTAMAVLAKQRAFADADLLRQQEREVRLRMLGQQGGAQSMPGASGAMPDQAAPPAPAYGMQDRSAGESPAPTPPLVAGGAPAAQPQAPAGQPDRRALARHYWNLSQQWGAMDGPGAQQKAQLYAEAAVKAEPVIDKTATYTLPGSNKRVVVNIYKDGTREVLPELSPDLENAMEVKTGKYTMLMDPKTMQERAVIENTQTPDSAASNQVTMRGQNMTDARARENIALKKQELEGAEEKFTPEAITNAAARYNIDGTLPPMGMGKAGTFGRAAILNKAAEMAAAQGVKPDDQRVRQLVAKGDTVALGQLQKQEAIIGAFEKNFNKNADLALEQSDKVGRTGVPIANKWIQAGKRAVTGDPELSAFDAVVKSTVNEYAKIVSGSMGNQQMAEGEVKKIESLLAAAQTPEQFKAVIDMMKKETGNRMSAFKEQKSVVRDSLSGRSSDHPADIDAILKKYNR